MKISGSKQRLCIGGWFLAALLLLGLNAFQLMSLEQQALVGYPQSVKVLQTKLQDFDRTVAAGVLAMKDHFNPMEAGGWFSSNHKAADNPGTGKDRDSTQIPDAAESNLPKLSGIIQALDPRGGLCDRAVLNGRVCQVQDQIDGFFVIKISPTAVVVRRNGRNWTLEGPTPYFSSDQGD